MPPKTRRALACNACRARKIRCNGDFPCANCQDRTEECIVPVPRRRRPRHSTIDESADGAPQVSNIDNLFQKLDDGSSDVATHPHADPLVPPNADATSQLPSLTFIPYQPGQTHSTSPLAKGDDKDQEDSSIYATEALNLEYCGPRSFLTFCSQPAVEWITSRVRSPEFKNVAKSIITDVAQMLKLGCTPSSTRAPDPSPEEAWRYVRAFFKDAPEQAFAIVEPNRFEARLRAHLNGAKADDKAWYALRNVVFASGCRIALSKSASFTVASQTSWKYFENALSVYTDIVFLRGSFIIVQALILLAYYSEGLGKTSLQYMLCSVAMRFACSKGLHRQPARSWNIPAEDVAHRNWIFWSIYCLEKQNCSRSGRPSVMDDDEISCQVPQSALSGELGETTYCRTLVDLMRLTSSAKKSLSSARALRQTPAQLLEAVHKLQRELDEVRRASEQRGFPLDTLLDASQLPCGLTLRQAQSIQFHYVLIVIDINTPLSYPWSSVNAQARKNPSTLAQIKVSIDAVARACRSAILATRQIQVDASCSSLIGLYTPIYCFINLFICILRGQHQVQSDLVLLDVALGYFSNLAYATDFQLSVTFAKDLARLARSAVEGLEQQGHADDQIESTAVPHPPQGETIETPSFEGVYTATSEELDSFGWLLSDMEEPWSDLLPPMTWDSIL